MPTNYENFDELLGGVLPGGDPLSTQGKFEKQKRRSEARQACLAAGGRWDSINEVCIPARREEETPELLPQNKPKPEEPLKFQTGNIETFSSSQTGRTSGAVVPQGTGEYRIPTGNRLPDGSQETRPATFEEYNSYRQEQGFGPATEGRTFLGVGAEDVQTIAQGEAARNPQLPNAQPVGTLSAEVQRQQAIAGLIQNIGQINLPLGEVSQAPIDVGQALSAGLARVIPSAASFAAGGAVAGALGGPGGSLALGTGGFIAGAIGGFASGVMSNIATQQKGQIGAANVELTNARTNMRQLATLATRDPGNADQYIIAYNQQLARVYQAQRKLQAETAGNLNKYIDDGTKDLAEFDAFLRPGGTADTYGARLQAALITGQPLSLTQEDIALLG